MQISRRHPIKKINLTVLQTSYSGKSRPNGILFTAILLILIIAVPLTGMTNTVIRVQTSIGGFDLELYSDDMALTETVNNFLNYVNRGDYDNSIIHRSVPGFVIQGGGFTCIDACRDLQNLVINPIPTDPAIADQTAQSNTRGTIAMAKAGPDTATSQWFVNLADNSFLDDTTRPDGGFTVFGKVLGNGMDVFDAIEALPVVDASRAYGIPALNELPAIRAPAADFFVVATSIGNDSDGDGITDRQENNGPNNGDANNDTFLDSGQTNVASFPMASGNYVVLEIMAGQAFKSIDMLEPAYGFTTFNLSNPPRIYDGYKFPYGYFSFDLVLAAPGDTSTVTMTLPPGQNVAGYFKYGPTPTEPVPHWYKFNFDGETGAEFNGNVVTLHFVDGLRGDSDLDSNNGVITDPGAPAVRLEFPGSSGGGGGCTVVDTTHRPGQAGAWWLLLLLIVTLGGSRRYRHQSGCT